MRLKTEFASSFKDSDLVVLCPVYSAGERVDKKYNPINFARLIQRYSKAQVLLVNNEIDLKKFFLKNLIKKEIIVCMGAGSISRWIREMKLWFIEMKNFQNTIGLI